MKRPFLHRLICLLLLVVLSSPKILQAFPSNTRLGYSSCQSCHVSPTGGGVLNAYGRMSSADFLSTWSYEGEAELGHGFLGLPVEEEERFFLGGDIRNVVVESGDYHRNIAMQKELEFAAVLGPVTFVGSLGLYAQGKNIVPASRRNYLLFKANDSLSFRVGTFLLAYGIHEDDHTIVTRQGLGWSQGQETLNAEVSFKNRQGEVFLSANQGRIGQKLFDSRADSQAFKPIPKSEKGVGVRGAYYLGKNSQFGASYYQNDTASARRRMFGLYSILGLSEKTYALLEGDHLNEGGETQLISYSMLGHEVTTGLHLQAFVETEARVFSSGFKVQWFPRPHWELRASYQYSELMDTSVLLFHYYL